MEPSLAVFDDTGHALIEISTGDSTDPPNPQVLDMAIEWSTLESPELFWVAR